MKTDNLKDFILQNQDQFDDIEPSEALLHRIVKNKHQVNPARTVRIRMNPIRWMSAAAAILVLFTALYFMMNNQTKQGKGGIEMAEQNTNSDSHYYRGPMEKQIIPTGIDTQAQLAAVEPGKQVTESQQTVNQKNKNIEQAVTLENEALYHYTRLIEVKQKQINVLKADEPLLFEQFSSDFEALEKGFRDLKSLSGSSINKEQVLQAMISNLEMQTELLNRQLKIIKSIKQKKHEHYETNYQRNI